MRSWQSAWWLDAPSIWLTAADVNLGFFFSEMEEKLELIIINIQI